MAHNQYGEFALDLVDRLAGLSSHGAVFSEYKRAIASFGFDFALIAELTQGSDTPFVFRHPKIPEEFLDLYRSQEFEKHDPVAMRAIQDTMPFEWRDASYDPERQPRAREVMDRASDFGMKHGFVIPVHSFDYPSACISISSRETPDITPRSKRALHLISIYALTHVQQLRSAAAPTVSLSEREREVLVWSAAGMSADETGDILGITERTVTFHMGTAMRKLGASNKTNAVALALARRLIKL